MRRIVAKLRPHAGQFLRYIVAGLGAVACDFGSYFLLLQAGVWYVAANIVGNILGFVATFLLQKYFVFGRKDDLAKHFLRFCLINLFNLLVQTALLWLLVERVGVDEGSAKFVSWAMTILWNFFLYKFLVYV